MSCGRRFKYPDMSDGICTDTDSKSLLCPQCKKVAAVRAFIETETNHPRCDDYCGGLQFACLRIRNILDDIDLAEQTLAEARKESV
jgi:hypothetical protein